MEQSCHVNSLNLSFFFRHFGRGSVILTVLFGKVTVFTVLMNGKPFSSFLKIILSI